MLLTILEADSAPHPKGRQQESKKAGTWPSGRAPRHRPPTPQGNRGTVGWKHGLKSQGKHKTFLDFPYFISQAFCLFLQRMPSLFLYKMFFQTSG